MHGGQRIERRASASAPLHVGGEAAMHAGQRIERRVIVWLSGWGCDSFGVVTNNRFARGWASVCCAARSPFMLLRFALFLILTSAVHAQVIINEFAAASSDRLLRWLPDGTPRLGSGAAWMENGFGDATWATGAVPMGWGTSVTTNLQSAMQNKTPTLYLRKAFTVSAGQAVMTQPLTLQVDADDGFVAFINGVEVARANAGGAKHFVYAGQPAYNAAAGAGIVEHTLGPANTLLVAGTNVLAIQALNSSIGSNFRINAGLKVITSTDPVQLTKAFYSHDAATGASRTRQRTVTTDSNSASGTPIAGGWLATAADPTTTGTWTSLNVVTAELAGAGHGGSGGLRHTIAQTGPNGTACWLRAPMVNMVNAWTPSSLNGGSLAATTLSFRYRMTGDMLLALRMDPALGQEGNSVDGFPVVGLPIGGTPDYTWATAGGGYMRRVINSTGGVSSPIGGSINIGNYEISLGTGVFSFGYDDWPTGISSLSYSVKNLSVAGWPASGTAISAGQWASSHVTFRWKMPVGRQCEFFLAQNLNNVPADWAGIGTLTGTGNWEVFSAAMPQLGNAVAFLAKLNAAGASRDLKLRVHWTGAPFSNGDKTQLDDVSLYLETAGETLEENIPTNFATGSGGIRTRTVSVAGAGTDSDSGTLVGAPVLFHDPAVTGMVFRVIEDTAPGGDGAPGHLRCEVTDTPNTGAPWGFSLPGFAVRNWTAGATSAAQLADVSLLFSAKVRAGVTVQVYAEPVGGSTANRANLGTITGSGSWVTVQREFATAGNVENFRTALNTAGTTAFQLTFVFPANPVTGEQLALDDVRIVPWRLYSTLLSAGTNSQRFLDYLNNNGLVTFIPTFSKTTVAPVAGATFSTDNFEVSYYGPDPNAAQQILALNTATWKYFVGLAEPAGGLFDPALLAAFPVPPGEEEEYDNPQNFRDWIELRNMGASSVNISGWGLSDDADLPMKWTFPAGTTIPAGGYRIVMCDDRDEANGTATYLHANFSLSASGERVLLSNAAGVLQSQVTNVPGQDTFHSWGRNPNGDGSYGFLDTATPGAANIGAFSSARVKTPDFFKPDGITPANGGFYNGPQAILLASETLGATVRYTLDGSEPTETTGTLYSGPISLSVPADGKTARVVRARAFKPGLVPSDSKTHSYLLTLNANLKGVPALLFSGNADRNFYAPHGIMAIVGGPASYDTWPSNPGPTSYNIPINRGDAYERKITAEWYYPDGKDGWRDDVGIRISSSPYSRPRLKLDNTANSPWISDHTEKPSFNLKWRDDYGTSSRTDINLIPGNDVTRYRELRVRAGKNDILDPFIIDEVARRLYRDMGWYSPIGTISTLYVNGSFKGFFNPTERLRQSMFQEHYRTSNEFDVRYIGEQVDGDATFWNAMVAALSAHNASPTAANYANALNYIDPVNVTDYFLCNIYINCDDWPHNNWGAQRERSPAGRYRLVMWDAEAAYSRFGKGITYNTLDNLILNNNTECSNTFKHLYPNPEFKLLVADRIQRAFFNGGVLDDRNPSTSTHGRHVNFFKALVDPVLRFVTNNAGESVDLGWYSAHINATTGRRAYLFGPASTAGTFASRGLWPATLPPNYSAFGGVVSANYPLTITSPTGGTIFYTLNGTDPRLAGGAVSGTAMTYTGQIVLNSLTTVNSRVRSAGGEWSALTEAYFQPGAVAPTATSLAVAEINYHPPTSSSAELAAGFTDSDDFEFIRLKNVGASPLDLRKLKFTLGIVFDFGTGDVLALSPGSSVLVVKRRAAFEARYGTSFATSIAGEYAGSLSNGGEALKLENVSTVTTTIASFTFGDSGAAGWPQAPDGFGPTLILRNPGAAPNLALPANWLASSQPGGSPGGIVRQLTYAQWRMLAFDPADASNDALTGPNGDYDGDGLKNVAEYGLGGVPTLADSIALVPPAAIEFVSSVPFLTYEWTQSAGAADVTVTPEVSGNLTSWSADTSIITGASYREDGVYVRKVRDNTAVTDSTSRHLRLKVTGL
jgi:Lamin Tail Domain/CotH kinase protein/Chitobiase/beta-hexosaminidase C-terminal domain